MYAELQAMSLESANHTDDEVTNEKMRTSFWPDLNFFWYERPQLFLVRPQFFGKTLIFWTGLMFLLNLVHPRSYLT